MEIDKNLSSQNLKNHEEKYKQKLQNRMKMKDALKLALPEWRETEREKGHIVQQDAAHGDSDP